VSGSQLGRRYARALFELGEEQGQTDRIQKGLEALVATWSESKELQDVFENPAVGAENRNAVIDAVGKRMALPPLLLNTLKLLSDRRRLRHVPELAEAYFDLAEARTGRVRAEVITATAMPETYFTKLQQTLEKATGKKVVLVKKQDPELIGGVVTRVGDRVFDGSIRSRLADLEATLLSDSV